MLCNWKHGGCERRDFSSDSHCRLCFPQLPSEILSEKGWVNKIWCAQGFTGIGNEGAPSQTPFPLLTVWIV